jgi:hypothetical protein
MPAAVIEGFEESAESVNTLRVRHRLHTSAISA